MHRLFLGCNLWNALFLTAAVYLGMTASPHHARVAVFAALFACLVQCGAIALFLAAVGIYGVLAYAVTQRTKEIGIRVALGSSQGAVFQLILREGITLIATGFVLGAVGTAGLSRSLESQLFGVRAGDPLVLAFVVAMLALVALAACAIPARRASRIDPVIALSG